MGTPIPRKWILIVEDDQPFRELLQTRLTMLLGQDVQYVLASDGLEATSRLPFTAFDLIVTDLTMPRKEGRAFIGSARESAMNVATPVIVVTGNPNPTIEREFEFVYHMEKPLDFAKFNALVDSQLKLGRTDERIAADLLNGFVDAVKEFFDQVLKVNVEMLEPSGKKGGDEVTGDYFRVIDFKSGKARGQFVVSFPEKALDAAHRRVDRGSQPDPLKVVENAGRLIFQRAMKKIGDPLTISVSGVKNLKGGVEDEDYKNLRKNSGIRIPLASEFGEILVYTLWK